MIKEFSAETNVCWTEVWSAPPSTLYHKLMVRVIVFWRLLGRKRRAGDAGHRQAALTPPKGAKNDPSGGHGWPSDVVARLS